VIREAEVRLVNQVRGLEGLTWEFAGQLASSQPTQLVEDEGHQLVEGGGRQR
jgi:hypothetical protein